MFLKGWVLKMKNTWIFGLGVFVVLGFMACDNGTPILTVERYYVSIPTAEQEANTLLNQIKRKNQNVNYPDTQLINTARSKINGGGSLTDAEEAELINHIENDIYNPQDYQLSYATVNGVLSTANNQIFVFEHYKKTWDFYIPEKYKITISLYQTSGMYNSNTGEIILPITKSNDHWGTTRPPVLSSILHESIHIGIEQVIIQKYNVPQVMKEYIVDQFMEYHFKSVVPNFWKGTSETPSINIIFQQEDVFDNLPARVEEFMENNGD
jgi:hypothetical protein